MSPIRPTERARYPKDWPAIRARILARAENRCEFERADGSRCNAPNGTVIARSINDHERWYDTELAENALPPGLYLPVKIVLTVAHLNHQPEDCDDDNLKAGCQLHHLRHDREHHARNAAATRRSKKQNGELFTEVR
jgi:hypothetical protein